jgi:hypothetical protein
VTGWIVAGILYVLGIGFFRLLGGIGAAGEAFRRWGETTAARRRSSLGFPSKPSSDAARNALPGISSRRRNDAGG